jgi:hypothetical protein
MATAEKQVSMREVWRAFHLKRAAELRDELGKTKVPSDRIELRVRIESHERAAGDLVQV